ncbi:hypothetical protein PoB_003788800, partial [Plakobranchus ocellatus]
MDIDDLHNLWFSRTLFSPVCSRIDIDVNRGCMRCLERDETDHSWVTSKDKAKNVHFSQVMCIECEKPELKRLDLHCPQETKPNCKHQNPQTWSLSWKYQSIKTQRSKFKQLK